LQSINEIFVKELHQNLPKN